MDLFKRDGGPTTADIGLMHKEDTRDPWAGQPKYSKGMASVASIFILLAALMSIPWRIQKARLAAARLSVSSCLPRASLGKRFRTVTALGRFLAYRQLPSYRFAFINLRLPVLGSTLIMSTFMLGFTIWAFAVQPFYQINMSFGSPPLALRTGMMALGLMPFVYVLGTKVNFISMLTGIGHERLQVYHQWSARFMLFLSTLHTIPFIKQQLDQGGTAALKTWFFSAPINASGVVAYVCLFFLVFGSMVGLRERCYELFVITHIPVAIVFLAYMFVHAQGMLTSWRYVWGTAAMYMLSIFLRFAKQLSNNSFLFLSPCKVEALQDGMSRITIQTTFRWKPGQHVFVRFPTIQPWASHPFTIVSLPSADEQQLHSTVVLMAQAQGGLTNTLYEHALRNQNKVAIRPSSSSRDTKQPQPSTWLHAIIDGPYGGDSGVANYDSALYISGGSGISFALASLLDLAWLWRQGKAATQKAHFVWSVRREEAVGWVREHLEAIEAISQGRLQVSVFVSGNDQHLTADEIKQLDYPSSWVVERARHPDVTAIIRSWIEQETHQQPSSVETDVEKASEPSHIRSAAVVVCGPPSMSREASNEVSKIQIDILRGRIRQIDEVYLVNEHFDL